MDQDRALEICLSNLNNLTLVRLSSNAVYTEDEYCYFSTMLKYVESRLNLVSLVNNLQIKEIENGSIKVDEVQDSEAETDQEVD